MVNIARRYAAWALIFFAFLAAIYFLWWNGAEFARFHAVITWQECVYGKPECSTAAATWALGVFGLLTFVAAYGAVVWARRAFRIEVSPILGQSVCARHADPGHPADKVVFLTGEGQIVFRKPALLVERAVYDEYASYPNAFENLGRSALSAVAVQLHIRDADGNVSDPIAVDVGNIRCDREVHLVVYVSKAFKPVELMWSYATQRGKKIQFFPESALTKTIDYGFRAIEQLDLPLVETIGGDASAQH